MSHVLHRRFDHDYPVAVRGAGIEIIDQDGRRYIDASGGAVLRQGPVTEVMDSVTLGKVYGMRVDVITLPDGRGERAVREDAPGINPCGVFHRPDFQPNDDRGRVGQHDQINFMLLNQFVEGAYHVIAGEQVSLALDG